MDKMSNSQLPLDCGSEAEDECHTACKVCKTLFTSAEVAKASNNAGKAYDFRAPIYTEAKRRQIWTITASELFNGCDNHEQFLRPYVRLPEGEKLTEIHITFNRGRLYLENSLLQEGDETPWFSPGAELLLLNGKGARPGLALGRDLDADFINTELLNHWKRTFAEHHGNTCLNRLTSLSHPLSYLIDTQEMCLIPAAPDMAYVALSYVWGQVRMLKTIQENLESLQKPKAL